MHSPENPLFKLISLRGPRQGLVIDPVEDHPDDPLVVSLDALSPPPTGQPHSALEIALRSARRLSTADVGDMALSRLFLERLEGRSWTMARLREVPEVASLLASDRLRQEYRLLVHSWLRIRLLREEEEAGLFHGPALRVGHLLSRLARSPESLSEAGIVEALLAARLVLPRRWRIHTPTLADSPATESSSRASREDLEGQWARTVNRISLREGIHAALVRTHARWSDSASGEAEGIREAASRGPRPLDERFYAMVDARLRPDERREFDVVFRAASAFRPDWIDDALDAASVDALADTANSLCERVRLWDEDEESSLPTSPPGSAAAETARVVAVGWGDLVVARERLVGYEAAEVAHIENVLAGEEKSREHERTTSFEELFEEESEQSSESEKDLQTTDRSELQTQSQASLEEEFAAKAGVNVSGRYGLTKIDASAEASFTSSSSRTNSSTATLAKEVVSRAVERSHEKTRRLRRVTRREQIRELNVHKLSQPADGSGVGLSGIYRWVDKVHEVQLFHYGTRLMMEFFVPEPALGLLDAPKKDRRSRLAPFDIAPKDINHGNYMCLTRLFGAVDVEPPPARFIEVGFAWASTPDEAADENKSEDTRADTISIPAGYRPVTCSAYTYALLMQGSSETFGVCVIVAGRKIIEQVGVPYNEKTIVLDPAFAWPNGVPVSFAMHGHFDRTATVQIRIRCERTTRAWQAWQLRTWEQLRVAHERLASDLEADALVAESTSMPEAEASSLRDAAARDLERGELRRWCIQSLRGRPFDFDAVSTVGDHQELVGSRVEAQAPVTNLFEGAFDWDDMSYFLFPYYWGRRSAWRFRRALQHPNARHQDFLRAGAARCIVPVKPGYEERMLAYLSSSPGDEVTTISLIEAEESAPDGPFEELWLELLDHRLSEVARGSGSLRVRNGEVEVTIDSDSAWVLSDLDLGREVFIAGRRYVVAAIANPSIFELDRPYEGPDAEEAAYATGAIPYSPPWVVKLPTDLVVLDEHREAIQA